MENEVKYSREELISQSESLFGVKREVVDGALHGNDQKEFTVGEMKAIIDSFLNRKVGN
jgi:hypothetical protein